MTSRRLIVAVSCVTAFATTVQAQTVYVRDTFTGADLTPVVAHTPDVTTLGSSWSVSGSPILAWGMNGDIAVSADYDGDGTADPAVFRPATGQWFVLTSSSNYRSELIRSWGTNGD